MDLRTIRQRCEARLKTLPIPDPFDLDDFCAALSEQRGRPILLEATPEIDSPAELGSPTGLWMAGSSLDVIFFDAATSPLHQEQIILHELSHLLCGHRAHIIAEPGFTELLLPHMSHEILLGARGRTITYSDAEEQEAELLASLISEQANRRRVVAAPSPASAAGTIARLEGVLEEGIER
jgi:hypothetical protein